MMMRFAHEKRIQVIGLSILVAFLSSCVAPDLKLSVKVPGEFKLGGVSKIALVKFNTLQDDVASGIVSADEQTLQLMQSAVASAFDREHVYKITDLSKENAIADAEGANGRGALLQTMNARFDAVVYGRVWWEIAPEARGRYPNVYALESWDNVKYYVKNPLTQKSEEAVAHVTTKIEDNAVLQSFRSVRASLMMSLSIYRVSPNGEIEKVVDTFSFATQKIVLDNGIITESSPILVGSHDVGRVADMKEQAKGKKSLFKDLAGDLMGKKDAADVSGQFKTTQITEDIPTNLQFKCQMGSEIIKELVTKLSPNSIVFNIPNNFSDKKIVELLSVGAFLSGKNYAQTTLDANLNAKYGKQASAIREGMAKVLDATDIDGVYAATAKEVKKFDDAMNDNFDYLYAMALCNEALGKYNDALYAYRLAFNAKDVPEVAQGISRCLFALDMAKRVKETNKELKKAKSKSSL